jgi:hypothetical protein
LGNHTIELPLQLGDLLMLAAYPLGQRLGLVRVKQAPHVLVGLGKASGRIRDAVPV